MPQVSIVNILIPLHFRNRTMVHLTPYQLNHVAGMTWTLGRHFEGKYSSSSGLNDSTNFVSSAVRLSCLELRYEPEKTLQLQLFRPLILCTHEVHFTLVACQVNLGLTDMSVCLLNKGKMWAHQKLPWTCLEIQGHGIWCKALIFRFLHIFSIRKTFWLKKLESFLSANIRFVMLDILD